jgi:hypothetical protein
MSSQNEVWRGRINGRAVVPEWKNRAELQCISMRVSFDVSNGFILPSGRIDNLFVPLAVSFKVE